MSRREGQDSGSRRHRSRFERDTSHSPKRSRREGKPSAERPDADGHTDDDKKRHRGLKDALPLEASLKPDSNERTGSGLRESDREGNGKSDRMKHSETPTKTSRSRSYFEHDERATARQIGARSTSDRGRRDGKDQRNEATENKRNEKSHAKENDNWSHDKFHEIEDDAPPVRKRRTFMEKKIPVDSEKVDKDASGLVKSSHSDRAMQGSAKEEDRDRSYRFERGEKQFARNRDIGRDERHHVFPSRERYGNANGGNYRGGRDRFSQRQGHSSSNIRVEKWKHDLFEESIKSPPPKNEEEQIAKLEALLSS